MFPGEPFFLYDSRDEDETSSDDDDEKEERPRVLVFAARRNLRLLAKSDTWFVDGTFKTAPSLFVQVFTVHGMFKDHALPFVYELLTGTNQVL